MAFLSLSLSSLSDLGWGGAERSDSRRAASSLSSPHLLIFDLHIHMTVFFDLRAVSNKMSCRVSPGKPRPCLTRGEAEVA